MFDRINSCQICTNYLLGLHFNKHPGFFLQLTFTQSFVLAFTLINNVIVEQCKISTYMLS